MRERAGDPSFVLLDVRTGGEHRAERLAGSVNLDFRSPTFREEAARLDRDKTYLVYCRTGNRSSGSVKILRELGFRDVRHLSGGISAWTRAGNPVERGGP